MIMLINSVIDFYQSHNVLFWLMGSLAAQDYTTVGVISCFVLLGAGWLIVQSRQFNLLSLGEEGAVQLGVDVETLRRGTFLASSVLVGAIVSVSGMIGCWPDCPASAAIVIGCGLSSLVACICVRWCHLFGVGRYTGAYSSQSNRTASRRRNSHVWRAVLFVPVA